MRDAGREWVTLTCASDRFDIDSGRVRCHCVTAEFAATADADVVVVVPAAAGHASSMIAHAATPAGRGARCTVDVAVRRAWARCARPYRFAYVDGRRHRVLGVSAPFAFDHRGGGPCDCDRSGRVGADDRGATEPRDTVALYDRRPNATARSTSVTTFVASLLDVRFSAPRCPACNVPSNYQQVLKHLATNTDGLCRAASDITRECIKQTERLNICNSLLEHHQIKSKILNSEVEDGLRFTDSLISSLLNNHKAIFWTGNKTIFLKIEKTSESRISANQRFMYSIINSQNQMVDNLTTTYKEILVMINTMQLFA